MALEAKEDFSMSNRSYDVTALGELLIDFTENGTSTQGNPVMEANPGGAYHTGIWSHLSGWGQRFFFLPQSWC